MKKQRIYLRYLKIPGIILFIGFLVVLSFQNPYMNPGNESSLVQNNNNIGTNSSPLAQETASSLELPFFAGMENISRWISEDLSNNKTSGQFKGFLAESNRTGSEITDNKIYFEDSAVGFDGLFEAMGMYSIYDKITFYNQFKDTNFWQSDEDNQGYYTWLDNNYDKNSTIMELNGNAQPIITFSRYTITEEPIHAEYSYQDDHIPEILKTQWEIIKSQFWDENAGLFNHSTNDARKYMEDQFIAAISGFLIHRVNDVWIDDSQYNALKSDANQTAISVMNKVLESGWEDAGNGFDYLNNADNTVKIDRNISLSTNAYGIWALCEWYFETGGLNSSILEKAENVFRSLNKTLWNSTYSLYMAKMDYSGNIVKDHRMNTKDNAIMMIALQRLFEATANFTYFDMLNRLVMGVYHNLKDPYYGNYYRAIISDDGDNDPSTGTVYNENKNLGDHAYLFRSYFRILELSDIMDTNIYLNATNFVKGEDLSINITLDAFFDMNITYGEAGYSESNRIYIENAGFFISIRYPNSTLAYNETLVANDMGNVSIVYNFKDLDPVGQYSIDYYANQSLIIPKFNSTTFQVDSGLSFIKSEVVGANGASEIYIGGSAVLNISINSSRVSDIALNISYSGDYVGSGYTMRTVSAGDEITVELELSVDNLAKVGYTKISVVLMNNSVVYLSRNVSFFVSNPINLENIIIPIKIFKDYSNELSFTLRNLAQSTENLELLIYGNYIETINMRITLSADESLTINKILNVSESAQFGELGVIINVSRVEDSYTYQSRTLTTTIVPKLQVVSVDVSESVRIGHAPYAEIRIINNLEVPQNISVYVNGKLIAGNIQISPGEIPITLQIDGKLLNPYDFGMKIYEIEIKDTDGAVIYSDVHMVDAIISYEGIFWGFIFPLIVPLVFVMIARHYYVENKKRMNL